MPDTLTLPEYPLGISPQDAHRDRIRGESFLQWVRRRDALFPELPRIGHGLLPRDEKIRFRQVPHTVFAPSTLAQEERADPGSTEQHAGRDELMVYFMGLFGPAGPLPGIYTDVVLAKCQGNPHPDLPGHRGGESAYRADSGPAAFIDLFNHRFISFFYRASVAAMKAVDYDRPAESRFHHHIGSLLGLGMGSLRDRMDAPDEVALYFSGHVSGATRHADGLAAIAADYCRVEALVVPNIRHWVPVPDRDVTTLGMSGGGLGAGTILGSRFCDRTMKFRLVLGPMGFHDYLGFKPGGKTMRALRDLVLLYCGHELGCEVRLVLRKEEVPELRLGGGLALGFSTWIRSMPACRDADSHTQQLT